METKKTTTTKKATKTKDVANEEPQKVEKIEYDCIIKNAIIQSRNDNIFIIIAVNKNVLSYDTEKQEFTERETIAFSYKYIDKILSSNVIGYDKLLKCVEVEDEIQSTFSLITNLLKNANISLACIPYKCGDTYITPDGEQRQFENDGVQPRIVSFSVDLDTLCKVSQLVNNLPK